jgi:hypothetical protein
MPLPLSALAGSPFDTYFVPGLILLVAFRWLLDVGKTPTHDHDAGMKARLTVVD